MDDEVSNQERELHALKGTQVIAGSSVPMSMDISGDYTLVINNPSWYNTRIISYKMSEGYHFVQASVYRATYRNSQSGASGNKSKITMNLWQLPQDGSGTVQFKVAASLEPTQWGTETITFSVVVASEEKGEFI